MKDIIIDHFQNSVDECLIRHKSILDILSKLNESEARINRAVCKSVTTCGCIEINAKKQLQDNTNELDLNYIKENFSTHIEGSLCPKCKEIIEDELGNNLFYLTCLCNLLNINLYDIFLKENNKIDTLGKFTLR